MIRLAPVAPSHVSALPRIGKATNPAQTIPRVLELRQTSSCGSGSAPNDPGEVIRMPASEMQSKDGIEVGDQFYIRASSSLADDRTRVLMCGDTFAIFDRNGDIQPVGLSQQGIFH